MSTDEPTADPTGDRSGESVEAASEVAHVETTTLSTVVALFRRHRDPAYLVEQERVHALRTRMIGWYAIVMYGGFWGLDCLAYPELAKLFGLIRLTPVLIGIAVLLLRRRSDARRAERAIITFAGAYSVLSLVAMCVLAGGLESNYLVGLILCYVALTTVEIFSLPRLSILLTAGFVAYVGANLVFHPGSSAALIVSTTSYLGGTTLFCIVGAALLEHQRRNVFEARALLAKRNSELERAQRHQREFLRTVSHELRTPLNSITGFIELIVDQDSALSPPTKKRLGRISDSADRLLRIINDILDLSAMEAGRLAIATAPFAVAPVLGDIAELTRSLLSKRDVEVSVEVDAGLVLVSDEKRVRQVLINLAGNAAKFTAEGKITLTARDTAEGIRISVRDTGTGIAAAEQARVFEAFTQTKEGEKQGGTGLGLNIVARLVTLLDARLSLESEVGKGTEFSIVFGRAKGES